MSKTDLGPELLGAIDAERQFMAQQQGSSSRRVKIDKVNQAWLVRFLPVRLGPGKLFYVRNAMHWLHKRPISCPRNLHPDFGGDPEAECPVCAKSDELNDHHSEEVSKFGYSIRANVQWITYCLCFQIDPGRGDVEEMPASEIMRPWEFHMYKGTYDELINYYRRGVKKSPDSVLDLRLGNDFWATKTAKGILLDKQDPTPIFEENDQFEALVAKVISQVKPPKIKLPSLEQLDTFAKKCEDEAFDSAHRGSGRRGDERSGRGARRFAAEEDEVDEATDETAEETPVRGRTVSRSPARTAPAARSLRPAPRSERTPAVEADEPQEDEQAEQQNEDDGDLAPQRPRAAAPRPAATTQRTEAPARAATTPAPASRKLAAPAAAARTTAPPAAAAVVAEDTIEDDDGVAPEESDLAPATDEPLPEEAQGEELPEEAPQPAPRGSLKASLKGRIQATARR
jgi:hypothetical protein